MNYLVLARKWRPQSFDDLVGQGHVSRTLAGAIAAGRVAHAFLFTGVRGVGKTTSARILAKALECEKGPTATPCLRCPPCVEIAAGADMDVQEIDGASYNGVDEVRRLQETLPYRPARDRFKIVIVDEVHMLSQNAWNAFLKTLEEPPPHVKFVFATTEVHKVPVTIVSRCQRYDFRLIPTRTIAERIRHILAEEKIAADEAAVALVAREAAGSMRDALSLLDQAIAWGGDRLAGDEVARVLGAPGRTQVAALGRSLAGGDPAACLRAVADLCDQGFDVVHVARELLGFVRDVVVVKVCPRPDDLVDLSDGEMRAAAEIAGAVDATDLLRVHLGLARGFDDVARSSQPRAALEMALVRLALRPALVPIDDLVARLGDLERRLGGGGAAGPASAGGGVRGAAGSGRTAGPGAGGARTAPGASGVAAIGAEKAPAIAEPMEGWRGLLACLGREEPAVASVLAQASLVSFGPEGIVVSVERESFEARRATDPGTIEAVERVAARQFGRPTPVTVRVADAAAAREAMATAAGVAAREDEARRVAARRAVAEHPLVRAAIETFDGELRDVRFPGQTN